jgi:protein-S-isoprenylcysteine O-methyltransferase Ste14
MRVGAFLERRRIAISWIFGIVFLVAARPSPFSLAAGLIPMAAGAALRTWASGHIRKQRKLARSGPYGYTRNPLYLGSFLMAAGALIMARSWIPVLIFGAAAVPLYLTIMRREEQTLEEKFGGEFLNYRRAVPLFFPRVGPGGDRGGGFDWGLVRKHREWRVWAGIAGVTLLLLAKYHLG